MVATASFARAARRVLASLVIAAALAPASVGARATREQAATGARTDRPATGGAPAPLLERDLLFGDVEITSPQISPEGTHFGFLKAFKGTRQVWVKKADEPMAAAKPVTADPRRSVTSWFWSRDGLYVLFVFDMTGAESTNLYAVKPGDAVAEGQEVPAARDLTQIKHGQVAVYAAPATSPDSVLVGINEQQRFDVYRVRIPDAERTLIRKNTDGVLAWVFDNAGNLKLGVRVTNNGDSQLVALATGSVRIVLTWSALEACTPIRFHPDNHRVYLTCNKGEPGLARLVLFDPETAAEQAIHVDPAGRVDVTRVTFSEATGEPAIVSYADDRLRSYVQAKAFEADHQALTSQLAGRDFEIVSSSADDGIWVVTASADVEPGETYLFDRRTKKAALQYRVREQLPRQALAPMHAIRYPSRDGLEIQAFLTLPRGVPATSLPLVVAPHGGPWARDTWGFNGTAQLWANRGYAVLQPNFRGSTGYGRKFVDAGNGQWGAGMQDDLAWGVKYLVAQGTVDATRVGIFGASFGGYAALAGVAFVPDVYHAAVAMAPPSDLVTFVDSVPAALGPVRSMLLARVGNPATADGKAALVRQSPLGAAAAIHVPVLIVQGGNDPRAKRANSDRIVVSLRDRHVPVEYLVAPDEGHGFAQAINGKAAYAAAEAFFANHLRGRVPPPPPPDVAARLAQLTVNPAAVVLESFDPATVTAPKPAVPLVARNNRYTSTLVANGRKAVVPVTQTIQEENGGWTATETVTSPAGETADTTTLEKTSLVVKSRRIHQGAMTVDLTFADGLATGTVTQGGQTNAVHAPSGGAIFADGAGAQAVLATLPLAQGYTTLFRTFNIQIQKPRVLRLRVLSVENVTVPAGTFSTWKAEVSSAQGEPGGFTFWVARNTRQVVKVATSLVQMPGATLTTELLP